MLSDQLPSSLWVECATAIVDVDAIGMDSGGDHFCAEFLEDEGCDVIGRAVSAIDHDFQTMKR